MTDSGLLAASARSPVGVGWLQSVRLEDLAVCFSTASLCFLGTWSELATLRQRSENYFRSLPPSWIPLGAALIDIFLLGALFWMLLILARRGGPLTMRLAGSGFMLILLVPIRFLQGYLTRVYGDSPWALGLRIVLAVLALTAITTAFLALFSWGGAVLRAARTAVLVLAPLLPVGTATEIWSLITAPPATAFADRATAPLLPDRPPNALRVIWLVFDELDERLVFRERPAGLVFPELDRFRGQSLDAGGALPPSDLTTYAMPALINGRAVGQLDPQGASELRITFQGSSQPVSWTNEPNVFTRARELGVNSALIGWHHPYCRILSSSLGACVAEPNLDPGDALRREAYARELGLARAAVANARREFGESPTLAALGPGRADEELTQELEFVRRHLRSTYVNLRARALETVVDRRYGLMLIHWSIPHPLGIFNRRRNRISVNPSANYIDNLVLVDRTLGELRHTLERAGLWDPAAVLLTSDHPLRPYLWNFRPTWTEEMARVTAGKQSERVPFLLKLPGQREHVGYAQPFNTVLSQELLLELLRNKLSGSQDVVDWLERHR